MPYGPANEIITHARECYQIVSNFYQQLTDKAKSTRVKMLLDYLARHEKRLAQTLADYEKEVQSKALSEWYHYSQEHELFKNELNPDKYSEDMSVDDVLKLVDMIDGCFIRSYQGMVDTATNKNVREIFENLLQMAQQERNKKTNIVYELNSM